MPLDMGPIRSRIINTGKIIEACASDDPPWNEIGEIFTDLLTLIREIERLNGLIKEYALGKD